MPKSKTNIQNQNNGSINSIERQPTKFEYMVYIITALSLFFVGFQISK